MNAIRKLLKNQCNFVAKNCVFKIHIKHSIINFLFQYFMPKRTSQRKKDFLSESILGENNTDPREFYLLEKLYDAMRKDKSVGRRPSVREFYLLEKLYDAIRKDKELNHKPKAN